MTECCVVCGEPVHRFVTRGEETYMDLEPGPKVHLECIADLPPAWRPKEKTDERE